MGLFGAISGLITGSVGNSMDNNEEDVLAVKRNLHKAGYLDVFNEEPEPHGFVTKKMDDGIRIFQKDNGLKVDGILHPRGETERGLFHTITGQILEPLFGETDDFDEGTVGFGGNVSGTFGINPFETWNTHSQSSPYIMSLADKEETTQPVSTPPVPPVNFLAAEVTQSESSTDTPPPIPPRKPETISPSQKGNELLNLIGKLESSDNYNVIVGGKEKPLTKMTVTEVRALQKERDDKGLGTPVGKYQIKDTTMNYLVQKMDLHGNEKFNEKLQDQMARHLLEHRGYEDFKAGKISTGDFIKKMSQEWAPSPWTSRIKVTMERLVITGPLQTIRL